MNYIFKTERLIIRTLEKEDQQSFFEIMGDPMVRNPIPRPVLTKQASYLKLKEFIGLDKPNSSVRVWGIVTKEKDRIIGVCGFLLNNQNDIEIAYSLSLNSWGYGYGTEIAKGLIHYGFEKLQTNRITADVNIENIKSSKILHKFMNPVQEFFNQEDNCFDRRYAIERESWVDR